MPNKPTTFTSRPKAPSKRRGGSHALRDRTAAYRRLCERILSGHPLCRYCRSNGLVVGATVIDHIVALSLGGSNDPHNLAPSCTACNDAKSVDERRFAARGYNLADLMRDPAMADWIMRVGACKG